MRACERLTLPRTVIEPAGIVLGLLDSQNHVVKLVVPGQVHLLFAAEYE